MSILLKHRLAGAAQGAVGGVFADEILDRALVLQPAMDFGDRPGLGPSGAGPPRRRDFREADRPAVHVERAAAMDVGEGFAEGAAAFQRQIEAGQQGIIV